MIWGGEGVDICNGGDSGDGGNGDDFFCFIIIGLLNLFIAASRLNYNTD